MLPMIKFSTTSHKSKNLSEESNEVSASNALISEFKDVHQHLDNDLVKAPQKCVNFILNFAKAYRTKKLRNGLPVEMIIN
jgi:hypothetical protein